VTTRTPEYDQMLLFSELCGVKLRNIIGGARLSFLIDYILSLLAYLMKLSKLKVQMGGSVQMKDCKICGVKWSWPILWHYPSICLEGLKKDMKYFNQGR
jgi:hypothetical protein